MIQYRWAEGFLHSWSKFFHFGINTHVSVTNAAHQLWFHGEKDGFSQVYLLKTRYTWMNNSPGFNPIYFGNWTGDQLHSDPTNTPGQRNYDDILGQFGVRMYFDIVVNKRYTWLTSVCTHLGFSWLASKMFKDLTVNARNIDMLFVIPIIQPLFLFVEIYRWGIIIFLLNVELVKAKHFK